MTTRRLHYWLGRISCAATLFIGVCAHAAWPERPVELLVGFAPGGGTDITARALASFLEKEIGTTVLVVNRPGASGALALAQVARAQPDGYTLGMTNMPGLLTLPIERDAGFTLDSFTFLANLVRDPSAFSVRTASALHSLDDVIAAGRKDPGTISYGSTGVGTDDHLAMVLFQELTGVRLNHVPFNGAGPLRNAVLGGHAEIGGMNLGEAMPYNGTSLRILAQASDARSPLAPDVPTFTELGVKLSFASERGVVTPAGLPADITAKLRDALGRIAANPAFVQQMRQQFTEMDYLSGEAWLARLKQADTHFRALWAKQKWVD